MAILNDARELRQEIRRLEYRILQLTKAPEPDRDAIKRLVEQQDALHYDLQELEAVEVA